MSGHVHQVGEPNPFFPAESGVSQNPVFTVIKMDLPSLWKVGMSQLPGRPIKAVMNTRLQTVCVIDTIETDLHITFLVCRDLLEVEGRHITPHAVRFRYALPCITLVD